MSIGYQLYSQCLEYQYPNPTDQGWLSCSKSNHPSFGGEAHWINYDLGYNRTLDSLTIWNYVDTSQVEYKGIHSFTVYVSKDGLLWSSILSDTLPPTQEGHIGQRSFDLPDYIAQQIVVKIDSSYGSECSGIAELTWSLKEQECPRADISLTYSEDLCQDDLDSVLVTLNNIDTNLYDVFWGDGSHHFSKHIYRDEPYDFEIISPDSCVYNYQFSLHQGLTTPGVINVDPVDQLYYSADSIISGSTIKYQSSSNFVFSSETVLDSFFQILEGGQLSILVKDCGPGSTNDSLLITKSLQQKNDGKYPEAYVGLGKTYGVQLTASDQQEPALQSIDGIGPLSATYASRLLTQASLGHSLDQIHLIQAMGVEEWIQWQQNLPNTTYRNHLIYNFRKNQDGIWYYPDFHRTWYHNLFSREDVLRQKVAFALSQIVVISSKSFLLNHAKGLTSYYDTMLQHSFGNYRDILEDITYSPMMGFYLSHLNNPKGDPANNIFPDENYAREVLQLFSIGLYELHLDGTQILDSIGAPVPTYDNSTIKEFARVFTGLGFYNYPFGSTVTPRHTGLTSPMQMFEEQHEQGDKNLLNGYTIPSGQSGDQDIQDAIDNIFHHPNVGPFLATRLIQRLIKSEPTPGYVERVATIFNDNGAGLRGDMAAVIKAILLDPEARDCSWINDPTHGKMKEPIIKTLHLLKSFGLHNPENETYYISGKNMEMSTYQNPLRAPSVFNFYQSEYQAPGVLDSLNIRSPEFNILDSYSSMRFLNMLDSISFGGTILDIEEGSLQLDYSAESELAMDTDALINLIDLKLTYGTLSERSRTIVKRAVEQLSDPMERIRMAIYIVGSTPEYNIQK